MSQEDATNSAPLSASPTAASSTAAKWKPLNSRQRRVLGVLVEKAKTVPDTYPMTLNALVNGCNQKSNRDPQMELSEDDVQQVIEELRMMGAVSEVQGSGRVAKYKHHAYEWLGVDKFEIAVMTELLLRGEQTLGELRGRASRMEAIPDLGTMQNIFRGLLQKNLVQELSPPGRGQLVSHNLYKDREVADLKNRASAWVAAEAASGAVAAPTASSAPAAPVAVSAPSGFRPTVTLDMISEIKVEVAELRAEVARLRDQLRTLLE